MSNSSNYKVNFFKPLTDHARANTKLITILFLVWLFSVFGFQFLLIIFNTPTPEKNYIQFEKDWPAISKSDSSSPEMKQEFSRTLLSVLGKNIAVKAEHKSVLKNTLSWSVANLLTEGEQKVFLADLVNNREAAIAISIEAIGLKDTGFDKLRRALLSSSLVAIDVVALSSKDMVAIPEIMELYLVHNRSALTDTPFLGFPFHYWYTAQYLLILFVVLCFIYAKITDRQNIKYNFVEED